MSSPEVSGRGVCAPEVCVLGAGPAGAALAGRLAGLGHDVVLVERLAFPRPRIGESLGPGIWPLLQSLGVRERMAAADFVRSPESRVRWRSGPAEDSVVADGLTVDRSEFDSILLDAARAAGVTVCQPARAGRPRRVAHGWEVPVDNRLLRPQFLVDATGRRRVLGGRRTAVSPATLALHAVWRGPWPRDRPQARVDVAEEGWLWGAHLPDGGFRAMLFVDPETVSVAVRGRDSLYGRLLRASPMFAELLSGAGPDGPIRVCDASTYGAEEPVTTSMLKVGEAAFAIDPLSSSGVQVALQGALAAGAVVHSVLSPSEDTHAALSYYEDLVGHTVRRHAATAAALYAEHNIHAETTFWRRRRPGVGYRALPRRTLPSPAPTRLRDLLPRPVRLIDAAVLRAVPCLVGDAIELRRALTHPTLDRPVAFLGGVELAPLLDVLATAPSLGHAIRTWDRSLSASPGYHIAGWLTQRGLIAAA